MTKTARTTMSLRDIAMELGLAPSTVVYYRDRFSRYLPEPVLVGRRKRYPPETVAVIRSIREMYCDNLSTEYIRETLASGTSPASGGAERGDAPDADKPVPQAKAGAESQAGDGGSGGNGSSPGGHAATPEPAHAMDDITSKLGEVARLLSDQDTLKAEISALRRELDMARDEARRERERLGTELAETRAELERASRQRDFMERYILKSIQRDNIFHSSPSGVFLDLPLVVQSGSGEYLGVSGKAREAFSVRSLVSLLLSNTNARMDIRVHWERDSDAWVLRVAARDKKAEKDQDLLLTIRENVTPSRNIVAQLTGLVVDGQQTPDKYLMALFQQIKDNLD